MGLIEEIKNLRQELHIDPLGWFEYLGQRSIGIEKSGPDERVSSQVAITSGNRLRKGARIVPQGLSSHGRSRSYALARR